MSRRLIITILIILIVGIVGGTAYLIANRFRDSDDPSQDPGDGTLQPSEPGAQRPGEDDGGDGGLRPIDVAPRAPIAVDEFFADNLRLTGPGQNLTEEYHRSYSQSERTVDTLNTFVRSQPIITQLPRPIDRATNLQGRDDPFLMAKYLTIAGDLSVFSNQDLFIKAINDLFGRGDPSTMQGVAIMIRLHQERLIAEEVPPSAENFHKLLLGYSELLAATLDQMAQYNEDKVKAALAMRQWEEIDKRYIPLINQELDRLRDIQSRLTVNQ